MGAALMPEAQADRATRAAGASVVLMIMKILLG
jgi:hypothetical protein